jgi:hypothetical protein
MRKPGEIAVGLCFLTVGIAFMIGAVKLTVGVPTEPKPGFFPFIDGAILLGLSVLFLVQAWRGQAGKTQAFGGIKGPVIVTLTLILYVVTLERVWYIITTTVLSAVVLYVRRQRGGAGPGESGAGARQPPAFPTSSCCPRLLTFL